MNSLKSLLLDNFWLSDITFADMAIMFAESWSTSWRRLVSCISLTIVSTSNQTANKPTDTPKITHPFLRRPLSLSMYCRSNSPLIKFFDKSLTSFNESLFVYIVFVSGMRAQFSAITLHTSLYLTIAGIDWLLITGPL